MCPLSTSGGIEAILEVGGWVGGVGGLTLFELCALVSLLFLVSGIVLFDVIYRFWAVT